MHIQRKFLIASALLNIVLVAGAIYAFVAIKGVIEKFHRIGFDRWQSQFNAVSAPAGPIIFLGDSMTEFCHWSELLANSNVINRGISGDTTRDILDRVDHILKLRPRKLFLMIGVNDLNNGIPADVTRSNLVTLFNGFSTDLSKTDIYIQSILPVNAQWQLGRANNPGIIALNHFLHAEADKRGFRYLDLHSHFTDSSGALRSDLSNDGIHLLGPGYTIWRDQIANLVNSVPEGHSN